MDIDLDLKTNFDPLEYFPQAICASMVKNGTLRKHPAGVYLQTIPKDDISNSAAIPYKEAEKVGYFKIDFLHLSLLDIFESKAEIRGLIRKEPDWSMLEDQETVEKLFQIHRHFDIVFKIKPKSVNDLADCMSIIRPAKRYLLEAYLQDKEKTRQLLYEIPADPTKYYFKLSHAISYSLNIVLQLHLIKANII